MIIIKHYYDRQQKSYYKSARQTKIYQKNRSRCEARDVNLVNIKRYDGFLQTDIINRTQLTAPSARNDGIIVG